MSETTKITAKTHRLIKERKYEKAEDYLYGCLDRNNNFKKHEVETIYGLIALVYNDYVKFNILLYGKKDFTGCINYIESRINGYKGYNYVLNSFCSLLEMQFVNGFKKSCYDECFQVFKYIEINLEMLNRTKTLVEAYSNMGTNLSRCGFFCDATKIFEKMFHVILEKIELLEKGHLDNDYKEYLKFPMLFKDYSVEMYIKWLLETPIGNYTYHLYGISDVGKIFELFKKLDDYKIMEKMGKKGTSIVYYNNYCRGNIKTEQDQIWYIESILKNYHDSLSKKEINQLMGFCLRNFKNNGIRKKHEYLKSEYKII